ncbi:MAG: hypothetical protein P9L92_06825 [Candidatus Electryonea clarkiae]|nr:hypothetical protein [Candidatus Electryonea clarkiae]MDP8285242.1 hypothetical protein [Candidatus Electryonea clarkiae]
MSQFQIHTFFPIFLIFFGIIHLNQNVLAQNPEFGDRIDLGLIEHDPIDEASGIAASRINRNVLYTHNDSGGENIIYAFNTEGKHLGEYVIEGCDSRDWEDIAIGPGPEDGTSYIFIGEFGDNKAVYDKKFIFRFPEPVINSEQDPVSTTISNTETITFQFPDGNRDAESLIVDPLTRDIYVISKRETKVRVYRFPFPQSTDDTIIPEMVGNLPLHYVVSGDISPSGRDILIKVYDFVYLYTRQPSQDLADVLVGSGIAINYEPEPQGEAVCWKPDETGYYTLSEEKKGVPARLYFYPRLSGKSDPR